MMETTPFDKAKALKSLLNGIQNKVPDEKVVHQLNKCFARGNPEPEFDGKLVDSETFRYLQSLVECLTENPQAKAHVVDHFPANTTEDALWFSLPKWQAETGSSDDICFCIVTVRSLDRVVLGSMNQWKVQSIRRGSVYCTYRNMRTFLSDRPADVAHYGVQLAEKAPLVIRIFRCAPRHSLYEGIASVVQQETPGNVVDLWIRHHEIPDNIPGFGTYRFSLDTHAPLLELLTTVDLKKVKPTTPLQAMLWNQHIDIEEGDKASQWVALGFPKTYLDFYKQEIEDDASTYAVSSFDIEKEEASPEDLNGVLACSPSLKSLQEAIMAYNLTERGNENDPMDSAIKNEESTERCRAETMTGTPLLIETNLETKLAFLSELESLFDISSSPKLLCTRNKASTNDENRAPHVHECVSKTKADPETDSCTKKVLWESNANMLDHKTKKALCVACHSDKLTIEFSKTQLKKTKKRCKECIQQSKQTSFSKDDSFFLKCIV